MSRPVSGAPTVRRCGLTPAVTDCVRCMLGAPSLARTASRPSAHDILFSPGRIRCRPLRPASPMDRPMRRLWTSHWPCCSIRRADQPAPPLGLRADSSSGYFLDPGSASTAGARIPATPRPEARRDVERLVACRHATSGRRGDCDDRGWSRVGTVWARRTSSRSRITGIAALVIGWDGPAPQPVLHLRPPGQGRARPGWPKSRSWAMWSPAGGRSRPGRTKRSTVPAA